MEKVTPSPAKLVRLVDGNGKVVKEVRMNRKQRRKLGMRGQANADARAKRRGI